MTRPVSAGTEPLFPVAELETAPAAMPASRAECSAVHRVERGAVLVCNWSAGHQGERHWDEGDSVLWQAPAADLRPVPVRAAAGGEGDDVA